MGVLALRAPGRRLEWDSTKQQVKNVPELNAFVRPDYRKGWSLCGAEFPVNVAKSALTCRPGARPASDPAPYTEPFGGLTLRPNQADEAHPRNVVVSH